MARGYVVLEVVFQYFLLVSYDRHVFYARLCKNAPFFLVLRLFNAQQMRT